MRELGDYQGVYSAWLHLGHPVPTSSRIEVSVLDSTRLSEIYAQHSLEAVRLAYMLTGDRAVAEDIVHEAFVRMVGRFKDRRGPEVAQAYLRQAVLNVTKNYFRRLKVERSLPSTREFNPFPGPRHGRGGIPRRAPPGSTGAAFASANRAGASLLLGLERAAGSGHLGMHEERCEIDSVSRSGSNAERSWE